MIAVQFEQVTKSYDLHAGQRSLMWSIRRVASQRGSNPLFCALKNINFVVKKGEAFGIIGRNGAGKSTVLKLAAGITRQDTGTITVKGRISSLIELGAGFNADLTGRENIFLNGAILGIPKRTIEKKLDEIIEFAELGEFIDVPVKKYSSGMQARLGFSVASNVDPEVLLVDEALAVGDIFFQQKCYVRMESLLASGTATIFVSHDTSSVARFCGRALLLDKAEEVFQGSAVEAVRRYYYLQHQAAPTMQEQATKYRTLDGVEKTAKSYPPVVGQNIVDWPSSEAFIDFSRAKTIGGTSARCTAIALCDNEGKPNRAFRHGDEAHFYLEFEALRDLQVPFGGFLISDPKNLTVHGKATYQHLAPSCGPVESGSKIRIHLSTVLNIAMAEYTFDVWLSMMKDDAYENLKNLSAQQILSSKRKLVEVLKAGSFIVLPGTEIAIKHFGVCDLPGSGEVSIVSSKT